MLNLSEIPTVSRPGRPPRTDIDMAIVRSLLPLMSMRKIGRRIGVHHNTLLERLKKPNRPDYCIKILGVKRGPAFASNPHCVNCRVRMYKKEKKYQCRTCGVWAGNCLRSKGRPPREIDCEQVSVLLREYPVVTVAKMLGVHRNILYGRMKAANGALRIEPRPFRTWVPAHKRDVPGFRGTWNQPSLRRRIPKRQALMPVPPHWPYMRPDDPRYDDVIKAIDSAVPRTLPDVIRADVCQEIMVSVLVGELEQSCIQSAAREYLRKHFKTFPQKSYTTMSLDAPVRSRSNETTEVRLIELIDNDAYQEQWRTMRFANGVSSNSTVEEMAERLAGAWETNRLNGNRKTYGSFSKHRHQRFSDPEYERLRRKYQYFNGKPQAFGYERDQFGTAWTVETALPEELRDEN